MEEPRRIDLVSKDVPSVPPDDKQKKEETRVPPTQRFTLTLTESTDDSCPEFSFMDLCRGADEPDEAMELDPNDPFAVKDKAENDRMVRMAQDFEKKYASKSGKRKRKDRVEDLVDIGDGYDEEDSFVDNTEAYDEYIPCTLSTKYGGFYINSGLLDLIPAAEDSFDEVPIRKKTKKQRIEDSDCDVSNDDIKFNKSNNSEEKHKKIKDGSDGSFVKRKRKKMLSLTKKYENVHNAGELVNSAILIPDSPIQQSSLLQPSNEAVTAISGVGDKNSYYPGAATLSGDLRTQKVPEAGAGTSKSVEQPRSSTGAELHGETSTAQTAVGKDRSQKSEASNNSERGPETIPIELLDSMSSIEKLSKQFEDGIIRQFTPQLNQLLLNIENQSRQLNASTRSSVFTGLGRCFACGKEGLMKRVKKLSLSRHDDKLKRPIDDLKGVIGRAMPALLEKYREEFALAEKLRQDRMVDAKETGGDDESDEEEDATDGGEKLKRINNPRKKFEWSDEVRRSLCRIVEIKMEHYEMSKIRRESPEDYLKAFLESEIKPLWGRGWVQTRMLFKESRSAHVKWTGGAMNKKHLTPPAKQSLSYAADIVFNGKGVAQDFKTVTSDGRNAPQDSTVVALTQHNTNAYQDDKNLPVDNSVVTRMNQHAGIASVNLNNECRADKAQSQANNDFINSMRTLVKTDSLPLSSAAVNATSFKKDIELSKQCLTGSASRNETGCEIVQSNSVRQANSSIQHGDGTTVDIKPPKLRTNSEGSDLPGPKSPYAGYDNSGSIEIERKKDGISSLTPNLYTASMVRQWVECMSNVSSQEFSKFSPEQLYGLATNNRRQLQAARRGSFSHGTGRDGAKYQRTHRRSDSAKVTGTAALPVQSGADGHQSIDNTAKVSSTTVTASAASNTSQATSDKAGVPSLTREEVIAIATGRRIFTQKSEEKLPRRPSEMEIHKAQFDRIYGSSRSDVASIKSTDNKCRRPSEMEIHKAQFERLYGSSRNDVATIKSTGNTSGLLYANSQHSLLNHGGLSDTKSSNTGPVNSFISPKSSTGSGDIAKVDLDSVSMIVSNQLLFPASANQDEKKASGRGERNNSEGSGNGKYFAVPETSRMTKELMNRLDSSQRVKDSPQLTVEELVQQEMAMAEARRRIAALKKYNQSQSPAATSTVRDSTKPVGLQSSNQNVGESSHSTNRLSPHQRSTPNIWSSYSLSTTPVVPSQQCRSVVADRPSSAAVGSAAYTTGLIGGCEPVSSPTTRTTSANSTSSDHRQKTLSYNQQTSHLTP